MSKVIAAALAAIGGSAFADAASAGAAGQAADGPGADARPWIPAMLDLWQGILAAAGPGGIRHNRKGLTLIAWPMLLAIMPDAPDAPGKPDHDAIYDAARKDARFIFRPNEAPGCFSLTGAAYNEAVAAIAPPKPKPARKPRGKAAAKAA